MLRIPTPGAGFCGARQVPRPLLLPCFITGDRVSGTTSMSGSGVLVCARGGFAGCDAGGAKEARGRGSSSAGLGRTLGNRVSARGVECCCGSSVKRCTVGGSSLI